MGHLERGVGNVDVGAVLQHVISNIFARGRRVYDFVVYNNSQLRTGGEICCLRSPRLYHRTE